MVDNPVMFYVGIESSYHLFIGAHNLNDFKHLVRMKAFEKVAQGFFYGQSAFFLLLLR
jgi:hypothetical protein